VAYLNEASGQAPPRGGETGSDPIAPRTPGLIWVHDRPRVGDVMVDRSFRRERLRPLGLCWAAAER
jgi:hypothetical protein